MEKRGFTALQTEVVNKVVNGKMLTVNYLKNLNKSAVSTLYYGGGERERVLFSLPLFKRKC